MCHRINVLAHYFITQFAALLTRTVSHKSRQDSVHRYSVLPWVGVHAFQFDVLQKVLGLYAPPL